MGVVREIREISEIKERERGICAEWGRGGARGARNTRRVVGEAEREGSAEYAPSGGEEELGRVEYQPSGRRAENVPSGAFRYKIAPSIARVSAPMVR